MNPLWNATSIQTINPTFIVLNDNTTIQQMVDEKNIDFSFHEAILLSSASQQYRKSFLSYENWKLKILKKFFIRKAMELNHDQSRLDIDPYHLSLVRLLAKNNASSAIEIALDIDNSLKSGVGRAHALSIIAHERAKKFDSRAVQEAINFAMMINDEQRYIRTSILGEIAIEQAKKEVPDAIPKAIEIIYMIGSPSYPELPLGEIAVQQAKKEVPNAIPIAFDILNKIGSRFDCSILCSQIAIEQAKKDDTNAIQESIKIANKMEEGFDRVKLLGEIAIVQAKKNVPDAIPKAIEFVNNLEDEEDFVHSYALGKIAKEQAKKNLPSAIQDAIKIATIVKDELSRSDAFFGIAKAQSKKDQPNAVLKAFNISNTFDVFSSQCFIKIIAIYLAKKVNNNGLSPIEEAINITNMIEDKRGNLYAEVLFEIAKARVKTDDPLAMKDVISALKMYREYCNCEKFWGSTTDVLGEVAREMAKKNDPKGIEQALCVANMIDGDLLMFLLSDIAFEQAKKEGTEAIKKAMDIAMQIEDYGIRARAFLAISLNCRASNLPKASNPMETIKNYHDMIYQDACNTHTSTPKSDKQESEASKCVLQ